MKLNFVNLPWFLLLVIVYSIQGVVATCDSNSHSVTCMASCDLGNCGVITPLNGSFLICTWNPNEDEQANYDLAFYFSTGGACFSQSTCQDYDAELGVCYEKLTLDECEYVGSFGISFTLVFSPTLADGLNCPDEQFTAKICNIAAPPPPEISRTYRQGNKLIIEVEPTDACGSMNLDYRTSYTVGTYTSSEPNVVVPGLQMDYSESSYYSFSVCANVQPTLMAAVWSFPSSSSILTAPETAVDFGTSVKFICGELDGKGGVETMMTWKKTGFISHFDVTVKNLYNNNIDSLVAMGNSSTAEYQITLKNLDIASSYQVNLVAVNNAGYSQAYDAAWDYSLCSYNYHVTCGIQSKSPTSMEVTWEVNNDVEEPMDGSCHIAVTADDYEISHTVNCGDGFYNVSGLSQCVLYDVNICYSDCVLESCSRVSCCDLQSYTTEKAPLVSPEFSVISASATSMIVNINDDTPPSESCGVITEYNVFYKEENADRNLMQPSDSSMVDLNDLLPYTTYIIQVSMVNSAGQSEVGSPKSSTTLEAAPSDPPMITYAVSNGKNTILEWSPPTQPNGIITLYQVFIIQSVGSLYDLTDECSVEADSILCRYSGNVSTANIKVTNVDMVSINACNGDLCSTRSESNVSQQGNETVSLAAIIVLCVIVGLTVIGTTAFAIHRWRATKSKIPTPHLHYEIESKINSAYQNNEFAS